MTHDRRSFLAAGAAGLAGAMLGLPRRAAAAEMVFTPEMFGAKGDGVTNDSVAMAKLAAAVNLNRGGTVEFSRKTYIVGAQRPRPFGTEHFSFEPEPLLEFNRCKRPLVVRGNGARLRCASGLRFGIFDAATGRAVNHPMPYTGPGVASPYGYMIKADSCTGPVEISDIELDGNLPGLQIGGPYGDTGWQIAAIGLALLNNRGPETVRAVHSHHHAQDGFYIDGLDAADAPVQPRKVLNLRSEYNGRQACSIVGGRGYAFEHCTFARTGRSAIVSKPGAGVDIEAEGGKRIRDLSFSDCNFTDNAGPGMVADSGDTEKVSFTRCSFVGTSEWSAWPSKPYFTFRTCTFVGAVARAFGDPAPLRATRFTDCVFNDDPALAPRGQVYGGANGDRPLLDLGDAKNIYFGRCTFLARHSGVLPWSTGAIYENCRMEQVKKTHGFPRGVYRGRNTITGLVDLYGARNEGEVVMNGKTYRMGWTAS
jgi:hypothetical protein